VLVERIAVDAIRGIGDDEVYGIVRDIPGGSADTVPVVKRAGGKRDTPYTRPGLFCHDSSMNRLVARLDNKWQKD
jgi:hypothetical protein